MTSNLTCNFESTLRKSKRYMLACSYNLCEGGNRLLRKKLTAGIAGGKGRTFCAIPLWQNCKFLFPSFLVYMFINFS